MDMEDQAPVEQRPMHLNEVGLSGVDPKAVLGGHDAGVGHERVQGAHAVPLRRVVESSSPW